MHSPNVTLIFPPFCLSAVDAPHFALPTLSAYLHERGVDCRTFDLNVRFYHWAKAPGGAYDAIARERIERFRRLQSGSDDVDAGTWLETLLRDVACAPQSLLEEHIADRLLDAKPKDLYGARQSLPKASGYHLALEIELWNDVVGGSIASTVSQAVGMHDELLAGPLGAFLRSPEIEALLESAVQSRLVGITIAFSLQLSAALAIAREIKRRAPNVMLVLGGSQITLLHDRDVAALAALPFVDAVARFEGEIVLDRLQRAARGEDSLASIPSLVFRRPDGTVQTNEPTRPVALNDLPVPLFNEAELPLYETRALPVNVTRGCYWGKCTFCDYVKLMAPGQPRYIGRDPAKVVDDIATLQRRHGTMRFKLITEALPPKWAAAFSKQILQRGIEARFWSYLKNEKKDIWSQDLLALMSAAGIREVTCGVESTTDRVLEVIDKGTTRAMIEQNFQAFANVGISAGFNLIPDYPTTTLGEAADGLRFVLENRDIIPAINPQMFDLSIQSAVAGSPEQFGIELTGDAPSHTTHGAHSLGYRRTLGLTDEERQLVRDAYLDLRRELARHHLTVNSRRVIGAPWFRWESCRILMHPGCRAIRSRFAMDGMRREVVIIVRLDFGGGCLDLPERYERTIALLTSRNQGFVAFEDLHRAYIDDVLSNASAREENLDDAHRAELFEACVEVVRAIAMTGTGTIYANTDDLWMTDAMSTLLRHAGAPSTTNGAARPAANPSPSPRRLPVLAS